MPLYVFECGTCNRREERLQVGFVPVPPRCECGPWMRLVITPASIAYKGEGWAKKERKEGKR